MNIVTCKNNEKLRTIDAEVIISKVKQKDQPVIGLATGSTPERTYELLVEKYKADQVSFKNVTTFNLDEYVGLEPTHINSYHRFMNERLFDHVDIDKAKTFLPDGLADNAETEAERFEALIKEKGPIDLQVLGLGLNGHIGFNEPGTPFEARTHVAKLVE